MRKKACVANGATHALYFQGLIGLADMLRRKSKPGRN